MHEVHRPGLVDLRRHRQRQRLFRTSDGAA
jgi:hypothetical protein